MSIPPSCASPTGPALHLRCGYARSDGTRCATPSLVRGIAPCGDASGCSGVASGDAHPVERGAHALILAIDQGTTETTCLVVDDGLRAVGRGYREIRQSFPQPGRVEHDPEEIWASVEQPVAEARGAAGSP